MDSEEPCSRPESLQGKGTAKAVEGTGAGSRNTSGAQRPVTRGPHLPATGRGAPRSQGPGSYLVHPLPRPQTLAGRPQLGLNRTVYVTVSAP